MYAETNPDLNVTNKGVAGRFKLAPSNLHKLVSGKKYHGGSHRNSRKASSLKELEEHGESMVQVIKKMVNATTSAAGSSKIGGKTGKIKSSGKITVMKTTLKSISLTFFDDETQVAGTRGTRKKKKEGDE